MKLRKHKLTVKKKKRLGAANIYLREQFVFSKGCTMC